MRCSLPTLCVQRKSSHRKNPDSIHTPPPRVRPARSVLSLPAAGVRNRQITHIYRRRRPNDVIRCSTYSTLPASHLELVASSEHVNKYCSAERELRVVRLPPPPPLRAMERAQSMTPRLNKTTTDDGFANASEPPASDWPAGSTCIRRCSREQRVMSNVQCVISIKTPNADQYRYEDDVNAGSMAWTKGVRATHTHEAVRPPESPGGSQVPPNVYAK